MQGTPSDDDAGILGHGRTDVRVAVVSMSARSPDHLDAAYLEWHALDHLPEQFRIPGVRAGARWVSTPACRAARAAGGARFDPVDHVVQYLFAEPVDASLATFFALGADLRAAGRMPLRLPAVELGGYRLDTALAAPRVRTGADVLPWRPARGAYLLIDESPVAPVELVDVPGVAGLWSYAGTDDLHPRLASTEGLRLTVAYLDDDPVVTAGRLAASVAERAPVLAAPFEALVPWRWDAVLPH